MRGIADYAVVYDITSDRERRRVDKLLKGFGFRIQKSVFECRMNRKGKVELIERLEKLQLKTGFVKIYRLEYSSKSEVVGERSGESIDEGNAFVV
ncbi:MAG: CRISPR-associated endonuclease Cas2 [Geobacter sp.]|nr:MAG: CRISPR-associated endonuclease Cas2 [Geobacter sp.]